MQENIDQLILDCQNKVPKAQELLFKKFGRMIMGICIRYTKSIYDAEDVAQETFIKIFENIARFRNEGSFEGWVRRIAVTTSLKKIKSNKLVFSELGDEQIAEEIPYHETTLLEMTSEDLMKVINTLPLGYKTVFNLYAVEGYTHKEISECLNITEGTSKSQYFHAKKMLKNILQQKNINAHA